MDGDRLLASSAVVTPKNTVGIEPVPRLHGSGTFTNVLLVLRQRFFGLAVECRRVDGTRVGMDRLVASIRRSPGRDDGHPGYLTRRRRRVLAVRKLLENRVAIFDVPEHRVRGAVQGMVAAELVGEINALVSRIFDALSANFPKALLELRWTVGATGSHRQ